MFVTKFSCKLIVFLFQLSIFVVKCTEYKTRTFAGDEVDTRKVPYTVLISTGCSGALIETQWVLSAAHCFLGMKRWTNMTVLLNTNRKNRDYEIRIAKVYIEPNFSGKDDVVMTARHDMALVKLAFPAILSESVQLLQLETKPWPKKYKMYCTLAGFGVDKSKTTKLHMGTFYFSHGCDCIQDWNIICNRTHKDGDDSSCLCDSGSVVVCHKKGVAVTSGTVGPAHCGENKKDAKEGCGVKDNYHLFTFIRPHLNWINDVIEKDGYLKSKANIVGVKTIQPYVLITNLQLFALLVIFSLHLV